MGLVTGSQSATRGWRRTRHRRVALSGRLVSISIRSAKEVEMSSKTDVRLTPGQRLSRGLRYTAVGPVDVTRGTVGLSWQGALSAAGSLRQRLENRRLARAL